MARYICRLDAYVPVGINLFCTFFAFLCFIILCDVLGFLRFYILTDFLHIYVFYIYLLFCVLRVLLFGSHTKIWVTFLVREAITKKIRSNLGKSPNREGGRSTPLNPIPNLLTVFFQKYLECSEMQNEHIKYFQHLQGVGLTLRII